jgi:hypothetical protein
MEFRFYVDLTFIQHSVACWVDTEAVVWDLPRDREDEFRMLFDNRNAVENFNTICKANDYKHDDL